MKTPNATPAASEETVKCRCPKCKGAGHFGPKNIITDNPFCTNCQGSGTVLLPVSQTVVCADCLGDGNDTFHLDCRGCSGTGRLVHDPEMPFHVISREEREGMKAALAAEYQRGFEAGLKKATEQAQ